MSEDVQTRYEDQDVLKSQSGTIYSKRFSKQSRTYVAKNLVEKQTKQNKTPAKHPDIFRLAKKNQATARFEPTTYWLRVTELVKQLNWSSNWKMEMINCN